MSHFIKKVVFTLHDSFANSEGGVHRIVNQHPFQVEEGGWGEFTLGIAIHFIDEDEPPAYLHHYLKLDMSLEDGSKKPVVSEHYDEIVFNRPSAKLRAALEAGPTKRAPPHPLRHLFTVFDEADDIQRLQDAQNYIHEELADLHAQLVALKEQSHEQPGLYPLIVTPGKDEILTMAPAPATSYRKSASQRASTKSTGTRKSGARKETAASKKAAAKKKAAALAAAQSAAKKS